MENENTMRARISFAAIDPYLESSIVKPTESKSAGQEFVQWGENNAYPDYLLSLSKECPTLRSVILGTTDFVVGDNQSVAQLGGLPQNIMNLRGDTIRGQVEDLARDFMTYGGFALQVIRGLDGSVVEIYYLDIRFLRSNKDNTVFYYSEKWASGRRGHMNVYPAFQPISPERWAQLDEDERNRHASSVLFVKNIHTQTYPFPVYGAAVKSCEIERAIDDYHLNAIDNGFTSSLIVNFNNGVPADEIKDEVERGFNEKFSGHRNAGRICFSWNDNKDAATTITEPKVEDFGDRYNALAKHCRQQIFTAFRANPNLFGIPTESLGFSQEEYESSFRLYNRTCVKPVQRIICDAYDRIYGQANVLTFVPFSIEETSGEQTVN